MDKIFQPNVNNRITAEKILQDPWLRKPGEKKSIMKSKLNATKNSEEEEEKCEENIIEDEEGTGPGEYVPQVTIRCPNMEEED